jgi:paraquat-inducible protein A
MMGLQRAESNSSHGLVCCRACGQIYALEGIEGLEPGSLALCRRCGSTIARGEKGKLHSTAAFSLAALALYFPANVFPILRMNMHGAVSDNTVLEGCAKFYQQGDIVIAVIVFLASVLIPLLKLLGLFFLVLTTGLRVKKWRRARAWVFRVIDSIGRWAMLDVFVVAILVSLMKLQRMATVLAGPGLLAFTAVVIFTLLASASFDPNLIWTKDFSYE